MLGPFSQSLSVLIYHRVVPEPDELLPGEVCARDFDWQLAVLDRWFRVLPLREAAARLREGKLPGRTACVTFDDGYADNETVALPLLRKRGIPATFFVATGFLDGGRMFNDSVIETVRRVRASTLDARPAGLESIPISTIDERRRAIEVLLQALKYLPQQERQRRVDALVQAAGVQLPSDLMMASGQVRHLRESGMEVGAHTVSHPILANLEPERASIEIRDSKRRLETITGAPVTLFAYPNGKPGVDYRREHVDIVRNLGFEAAVSTAWGVSLPSSEPYQLPRFTPWDRTPGRFLARLMRNTFRTDAERV
jgi:peptidoglycan/xylan/chitin deacetylase (PgdA/CDA1 family)